MPEQTTETINNFPQDNFDKGEAGVIPKQENIKKLFINKNFAILIIFTIVVIETTIVVGQIYENKKNFENLVSGINDYSLTRVIIKQANEIAYFTECIKTKSEVECRAELNK